MDTFALADFQSDSEVVILPTPWAPPSAALGIGKVAHVTHKYIQLSDGRIFDFSLRIGLNTTGCIARITPEHLKVLKMVLSAQSFAAQTFTPLSEASYIDSST